MNVTLKDRRSILTQLETGPKTHAELVNATEYDWDEIQSVIRDLRNDGEVRIRIDRRYELVPDE